MKQFWFILLLPTLLACVDKKDFRVQIQSGRDGGETLYISDPAIITVTWKSYKPTQGTATLLNGDHAPVLTCDVPTRWDDPANDKQTIVKYEFTPQDKPGNWSIAMSFSGEEIVYTGFTVLPPQENPGLYKSLPCVTTDGRVAPHNFYQLSNSQRAHVTNDELYWDLPYVIYEIKKRSYMCASGETDPGSWDDWESWLTQLSGMSVRQQHPTVHESIAAVMPVYEEEFLFVNPEFVQWFSRTLVPDPIESPVNGSLYQEIYDKGLRNDAREMALTFLYYMSLPDSGLEEQVRYAEMAARKYVNTEEGRVMERNDRFSAYDYITERYGETAPEWVASRFGREVIGGDPYVFQYEQMAFWLRRGIDGSADELWLALCGVLRKYDEHWYFQMIAPNWVE